MLDLKRKTLFQPGHQLSKGKGRPPGSVDSKRHLLTKLFLEKAEAQWPLICDKLFEEAFNGNTKVLMFIAEYVMCKPSQVVIYDNFESNIENNTETLKNMSSEQLRQLASKALSEKHIN